MSDESPLADEPIWSTLIEAKNRRRPVTGSVIELVKGGLAVDVGVRAFLPAPLLEMRRVRDLSPYVGKTLEALVIEADQERRNVILSRKDWLLQVAPERRRAFLGRVQPGETWPAVVSSLHHDGVVVDFGDFAEGVIVLADLTDTEIDHPGKVVEVGEGITVRVISVDHDRQYASLALVRPPTA